MSTIIVPSEKSRKEVSPNKSCSICQAPSRITVIDNSRLPSRMEVEFAKGIETKIKESEHPWDLDVVHQQPICGYVCPTCGPYIEHLALSAGTLDAHANAARQEARQNGAEEEKEGSDGEGEGSEGSDAGGWWPPSDFALKYRGPANSAPDDSEDGDDESNLPEAMKLLFVLQCAKGRLATNEFFQSDPRAFGRMQEKIAPLLESISDVEREQAEISAKIFSTTQALKELGAVREERKGLRLNMDPDSQRKRRGLDFAPSSHPPAIDFAPPDPEQMKIDGIVDLVRRTANTTVNEDISSSENTVPPFASPVFLQKWVRANLSSPIASGHRVMMALVPPRPPHSRKKELRAQRDQCFLDVLQVLIIPRRYATIIQENSFPVASVALSAVKFRDVDVGRHHINEIVRHLAGKGLTVTDAENGGQYCRKFAEAQITSTDNRYNQKRLKQILVQLRDTEEQMGK
ncbi:hypothetical protein B0H16DRAFT_1449879 [Mycena metata]|uniref:Uncharacterized protein n=1 Tax=Mycena metata TaxID=1033252 RepID=A0AAD7K3L9_9AGAR|nr:hypothetical protein B0H16DRAFT_1449879 [Mycena metata]